MTEFKRNVHCWRFSRNKPEVYNKLAGEEWPKVGSKKARSRDSGLSSCAGQNDRPRVTLKRSTKIFNFSSWISRASSTLASHEGSRSWVRVCVRVAPRLARGLCGGWWGCTAHLCTGQSVSQAEAAGRRGRGKPAHSKPRFHRVS